VPAESWDAAHWTEPKMCLFWHTAYLLLHFCINMAMNTKILLLLSVQEAQHPLTGQSADNFWLLANQ